ncbi:hypothetical protein, partial [Microbacterium sp.]|uniref:hypothetical protein n=1 Tax=Microbacterium sp. TaxID=51671 RepID=UPI0032217CB5
RGLGHGCRLDGHESRGHERYERAESGDPRSKRTPPAADPAYDRVPHVIPRTLRLGMPLV